MKILDKIFNKKSFIGSEPRTAYRVPRKDRFDRGSRLAARGNAVLRAMLYALCSLLIGVLAYAATANWPFTALLIFSVMALGFLNRGKSFGREIHGFLCGGEQMKFSVAEDLDKWNAALLHEKEHNRVPSNGEGVPYASLNGNVNWLFNSAFVRTGMSKGPISFQNHHESFSQILFNFPQGSSLSVHSGNFLNIANVPFAFSQISCSELSDHGSETIAEKSALVEKKFAEVKHV